MEYTTLGRNGVKISRICLGTMMFGSPTSEADSIDIINKAYDDGVNFIDTANVYNDGESERITGKAIKDKRDKVVLVTKVCGPRGDGINDGGVSRYHIMNEVENSLRRLGTDYIDIYMLHRAVYDCPIEESLRALDDLVAQGKIRYPGCSNFYGHQITEALWIADKRGYAPMSVVQPLYNIVNRDPEVDLFPACEKFGVGTMIYSPLARGVLAGKYLVGQEPPEGSRAARKDLRILITELRDESFEVAQAIKPLADAHGKTMTQFSLNWVLGNPIVSSAIVGPRTMEQYVDNVGCLGWEIDDETLAKIDKLVPPGEHTGWGFNDPQYPVIGRPKA
ncbi:MAG: NADP-dependent oxidoreductase [Gemmatimonadetes bacterium]|nr:NADP-dependent oxidoreductase [Gemmatimonadota bacterium]